MKIDYVIVQAGGRGTRLGHLTKNKPKALVPVENLPILFHLFRKFPDKKYVIIGDYKKEVLRRYLAAFAEVKYLLVDAEGASGTCSGIGRALEFLPEGEPFLLIWSDLILPEHFKLPQERGNYIGISETFSCRWSYREHQLEETSSVTDGVAGMFIFEDKSVIRDVPDSGELVRWFKEKGLEFREIGLSGTREYGLLEEYVKAGVEKCRPFNRMTIAEDRVIKEGIDARGKSLAVREQSWYRFVSGRGFDKIPQIYGYDPLILERIKGKNIYECQLPYRQKLEVLEKLIKALRQLHGLGQCPADYFSLKEAYLNKTFSRIEPVRDMIPFAGERVIAVNGRKCRNVFFYREELEKRIQRLRCGEFRLLHGDCTFSNMLLRGNGEPVLIDPRGYFGFMELYGDPLYDWAKLYYSIKGNYDRFNLKDFRLEIQEHSVKLDIASSGWEELEDDFFRLLDREVDPYEVKLVHALIWLSLTTYAWQDFDSVCGAFYNGLYYLEEVL